MSDYYVSSLAGGGGSGTEISPFTFAEGITFINTGGWNDGDTMWIKADGTYNFTTEQTITNASVKTAVSNLKGYTTTIGDGGQATLRRSSGTVGHVLSVDVNYWNVENFIIDANSLCNGMEMTVYVRCYNILSKNATTFAFDGASGTYFENCTAQDSDYGFYMSASAWATAYKCLAFNCGARGYFRMRMISSVAYNCVLGLQTDTSGGAFNSAFIQCTTGIKVSESWNPVSHNDFTSCTTAISYDDVNANSVNEHSNFYNNTTKSNDLNTIKNDTAVDSEYSSIGNKDYRRTGGNLDFVGNKYIGAEKDYDLQFQIGVAPRELFDTALPTFTGITSMDTFNDQAFRVQWVAGSGTITGYNIYIKHGNATGLFTDTYRVCSVQSADTSAVVYTLANEALLINGETYYMGVRAYNTNGEDSNSVSLNEVAVISNGGATPDEIWDHLTSGITTSGSIGKLITDNVDGSISDVISGQSQIMINVDAQKGTGYLVPFEADQAARTVGDDDGGTVSDMQTKNGVYYDTGVTVGGLTVEIQFDGDTSDENQNILYAQVSGYYEGQANTLVLVNAYNYQSAAWENRAIMRPRSTSFDYFVTLNYTFRNGLTGEMKLQFVYLSLGPAPDTSNKLRLDYISWKNLFNESFLALDLGDTKKVLTGRWKLEESTNTMTFYDTDGTTALYAFDMKDKDGDPAVKSVFERVPQ